MSDFSTLEKICNEKYRWKEASIEKSGRETIVQITFSMTLILIHSKIFRQLYVQNAFNWRQVQDTNDIFFTRTNDKSISLRSWLFTVQWANANSFAETICHLFRLSLFVTDAESIARIRVTGRRKLVLGLLVILLRSKPYFDFLRIQTQIKKEKVHYFPQTLIDSVPS